MLLPNKYISLSESFIGLSALILETLKSERLTVDMLWAVFQKKYMRGTKKSLSAPPTYQKFILVLEFMFLVEMITYDETRKIYNENRVVKDI